MAKAQSVSELEREINSLHKEYRDTHIRRLNAGKVSPIASILFLDLLSNLERVGDHAMNIADTVADVEDVEEKSIIPA